MAQATEYLTHEILALAFAVHRVNGGYYKDTRRFSEDTPTLFSNKEAVKFQLESNGPNDFSYITVSDKDYLDAKESVEWLHKDNALAIIGDTLNDFMQNIMASISRTTSTTQNIGLLSVVPKVYFDAREKKEHKKDLKTNFGESKLISTIGSRVEGNFTLQGIKFVEKFSCYVLNGHIEGDLISFFKNFDQTNELPIKGSTFKISGKVKRHGKHYVSNLPETILNYVRIG
jgi:hypothetical protein|tara:strand:+ start:7990 stop:8679 length:690 start_codon:yes stop_codon:yes gene_type:complete